MALFELTTDGAFSRVPSTTFVAQHVLERADLQSALRSHIDVIGEGLLVVAEEFGDFEDIRRCIDLLCVDLCRHRDYAENVMVRPSNA